MVEMDTFSLGLVNTILPFKAPFLKIKIKKEALPT